MKILITILFICVSTLAFSQAPKQITEIKFDAYGKFAQNQHESLKAQAEHSVLSIQKQWQRVDSAYFQGFIVGQLLANGIDLKRISIKGDSLKITPEGIFFKLKKQ